jgi:hypothetical protein
VVGDRTALSNQLVESLAGHDTLPVGIGVRTVVVAGRRAVDGYPKVDRPAFRSRTKHQMQITRMEAIDDAAVLAVERGVFSANRPVAGQPPVVEVRCRGCIDMGGATNDSA